MKRIFLFLLPLALILPWLLPQPAAADSQPFQAGYQTPTPNPDGQVIYVVKEGDSCLQISLLTGVTIDQIRSLNNLAPECPVAANQRLVLALVTPSAETLTPGPSATPTPILPTPTVFPGSAQVCIDLYEDANGNAMRDEGESSVAGGQVSLSNRDGSISQTGSTSGQRNPDTLEWTPVCFAEIPPGDYNITVAIPQGYNPTTVLNYALPVKAGDEAVLAFGAQARTASVAVDRAAPEGEPRDMTLGLVGGFLLLAGIGLGVYLRVARRG